MSSDDILDVIIVGGGFTGISAARELDRLGIGSYRLVDAFSDHLGGRAYSYDAPGLAGSASGPSSLAGSASGPSSLAGSASGPSSLAGSASGPSSLAGSASGPSSLAGSASGPSTPPGTPLRFDHGAEYVGDLQNDVMQLIRDELPADALVNGANLRRPYPYQVMILDGTRHVFRLDQSLFGITGMPPDLGMAGILAVIGLLAELTLIELQIDVLEPWNAPPHLLALDQISIWDWLHEKDWVTPAVRDLLRISVEALLSVEPSEISPYYFLWYVACNNGLIHEVNDDAGGPQQYWLSCGLSTLAEKFAAPVRDRIEQGARASRIDLSGDTVKVTLSDERVLEAKKVLVAMSPHTAGRIEYVPPPSAERRALMDMPMGRTLKCQVYYKSAWWHDSNGTQFNGYCGGANYPVLWVMDNSPPAGAPGSEGVHVLMTFTVGAQLDALGHNPTHEQVVAHVTGTLRTLYDDERALSTSSEFVRLVSRGWTSSEGFVGGGPNTVFTVGALTSGVGRMLNEHWDDKVFFASAENAQSLHPVAKSPRWNLLNPDREPKYSPDGLLLADPPPPFCTNYSDWRQSLGYVDGAIVSGRYVAHELAESLGRDNSLADAAAASSSRPDAPDVAAAERDAAGHSADGVLNVMTAVLGQIGEASPEDVRRSRHPRGLHGFSAWLHHALDKTLAGDTSDPVRHLTMIRDFSVTTCRHLQKEPAPPQPEEPESGPSVLDRIRGIVADVEAKVKEKLG